MVIMTLLWKNVLALRMFLSDAFGVQLLWSSTSFFTLLEKWGRAASLYLIPNGYRSNLAACAVRAVSKCCVYCNTVKGYAEKKPRTWGCFISIRPHGPPLLLLPKKEINHVSMRLPRSNLDPTPTFAYRNNSNSSVCLTLVITKPSTRRPFNETTAG